MRSIIVTLSIVILLSGLLVIMGCNSSPKYNILGKWETTINYGNGKTFTPQWIFKEDGSFFEFTDEAWGSYKIKGDMVKITSTDGKQYYSGTFSSGTHMIGKLVYVGFEDKNISVTWEAVKIDE